MQLWYARDQKEMSTKYRTMHGHLTSTMHTKMTVQKELVKAVLSNKDMWDQDLTEIKGLEELIVADLKKIREEGAEAAYASCL